MLGAVLDEMTCEEGRKTADMAEIQSLQLPTIAPRSSILIAGPELEGTIAASLHDSRGQYGDASQSLIRGAPVRERAPSRSPAEPYRLRAKDLVAELDSINSQIHKIMFQVERAVARLATSG